MTRPAKRIKDFDITIEKLVHGGMGLGKHQGKVIFVPLSVPGDRLLVHAVEEKKTFIRAEISRILKPGPGRIKPACPHFGRCGGCHLQQLDYRQQVEAKRQILEEILYHRFPEIRNLSIVMRACPQPFGYRSRARVQLRGAGRRAIVGFHRHRSHAVEDIEECPLLRPLLNEALSSLKQFKLRVDLDAHPQEMDIACSNEEGSWATARVGMESGEAGTILLGTRRMEESILKKSVAGFTYSLTPSVFFQANDLMVPELSALVRKLSAGKGRDIAVDLFSGVGLFSLPMARRFRKVIAVESSPAASRLCAANAAAGGFHNIQAFCSDVASWIKAESSYISGKVDLIVLDPPRSGAGAETMEQISGLAPQTILYISCDPQTLCRDLASISTRDYRIDFIEGMDMFPQTYHFETVVRLVRK